VYYHFPFVESEKTEPEAESQHTALLSFRNGGKEVILGGNFPPPSPIYASIMGFHRLIPRPYHQAGNAFEQFLRPARLVYM
jgi:hypothetical protein